MAGLLVMKPFFLHWLLLRQHRLQSQTLAEAQTEGCMDKTSKKQQKLEEAQADLDEARSMLNK